MAAARAGRAVAEAVPLDALELLAPEALVLSSLEEGRLDAAAELADLARRAGVPVGSLYAAALALERGDEAGARALASESHLPLESRGLGSRLRRVLEARDAGATTLLLDRQGELVAIVARAAPSRLSRTSPPSWPASWSGCRRCPRATPCGCRSISA